MAINHLQVLGWSSKYEQSLVHAGEAGIGSGPFSLALCHRSTASHAVLHVARLNISHGEVHPSDNNNILTIISNLYHQTCIKILLSSLHVLLLTFQKSQTTTWDVSLTLFFFLVVDKLPTLTGELPGFLNHQRYHSSTDHWVGAL